MRIEDDEPREERMNKRTKSRKRRRANSIVKNGKASVRKHTKIGGRTGHIQTRRTPAKRVSHRSDPAEPAGTSRDEFGWLMDVNRRPLGFKRAHFGEALPMATRQGQGATRSQLMKRNHR